MDFDNNTIVFGYIDEGGKYTLKMTCKMASETEELVNIDVSIEDESYKAHPKAYKYAMDKTYKEALQAAEALFCTPDRN